MSQPPVVGRRQPDLSGLYRLHARALERNVTATVRTSQQDAQDACSFAWMQLLTHTVTDEHVLGWLFVVATRQALRLAERSQRTVPLPQNDDGEALDLIDPLDWIAARERLIDAGSVLERARLSDRQRRIVAMQAAGLSYKEIAERTGDSILTVQRQLLRAHNRIRKAGAGGATLSPAGSRRSG
jgi:RNA polymerase sigma factor (sigma-70 family)